MARVRVRGRGTVEVPELPEGVLRRWTTNSGKDVEVRDDPLELDCCVRFGDVFRMLDEPGKEFTYRGTATSELGQWVDAYGGDKKPQGRRHSRSFALDRVLKHGRFVRTHAQQLGKYAKALEALNATEPERELEEVDEDEALELARRSYEEEEVPDEPEPPAGLCRAEKHDMSGIIPRLRGTGTMPVARENGGCRACEREAAERRKAKD